jgi:hypothetical protein
MTLSSESGSTEAPYSHNSRTKLDSVLVLKLFDKAAKPFARAAPNTLKQLAAMQSPGPVHVHAAPGLLVFAHAAHVKRPSMSYEVMTTCTTILSVD